MTTDDRCQSLAEKLTETTELLAKEIANRRDASAEAVRLWRIAICDPDHIEAMQAEVNGLGTATPEACRAISVMNCRLNGIKANQRIADLQRMVRTAQDAAVAAILESRERLPTNAGLDGPCGFTGRGQIWDENKEGELQ